MASFPLLSAACGATTSSVDNPSQDGGQNTAVESAGDAGRAEASASGRNSDGGQTVKSDTTCSASTKVGDACSVEGAFCNTSPCTDECAFCNALRCEAKTWRRVEAPPMPRSYCAEIACGGLTCTKGEFCVLTHSGPMPVEGGTGVSAACEKLPQNCYDCSCATSPTCAGMATSCAKDATSSKPVLDCYAQ